MPVVNHPALNANPQLQPQVAYQRAELAIILAVYGRFVAAGLWRDYGE